MEVETDAVAQAEVEAMRQRPARAGRSTGHGYGRVLDDDGGAAVVAQLEIRLRLHDTRVGGLEILGKAKRELPDAEEEFADQAVGLKIQPYRIETEARKIDGTRFKVAAPFSS